MKNFVICIIGLTLFSIFSVNAFGQLLYVNPDEDELIEIKDSKYVASSINVLRNSNGELISVVISNASKYLPNPITDQFLDTLPIVKQGMLDQKNIEIETNEINEKINIFKKKIKKNIYKISVAQNKGMLTIKKILINNVYR